MTPTEGELLAKMLAEIRQEALPCRVTNFEITVGLASTNKALVNCAAILAKRRNIPVVEA